LRQYANIHSDRIAVVAPTRNQHICVVLDEMVRNTEPNTGSTAGDEYVLLSN
jgi:hypothetical protein